MDDAWLPIDAGLSPDDDLIEYSVKRWAPFVCRLRRRIVAVSTEDVLKEYARRLIKPVDEVVDRYRKVHNSRRRHRPKRGLPMIWDVNTNRPRVLFYWTSGRSHFWCCDPLQLCPARFIGDTTLPAKDTIEEMVDYSLNVLSFFDPCPVIEDAPRHRIPLEYLVALHGDEDSSASEDTFRPAANTPTVSTSVPTVDDPIIPYRPEESSSSGLVLSESDAEKNAADDHHPTPNARPLRPPKAHDLDAILDQADINNIISAMQESRPLTGNDIIRTVETIRHRSIFSPRSAFFSPLVPANITFPANVHPMPAEFDTPRPVSSSFRGRRLAMSNMADIETQTEPTPFVTADAGFQTDRTLLTADAGAQTSLSQDSAAIIATHPTQIAGSQGDDISLADVQQWLTQPDESLSQVTPLAYWRAQFPFVLHFCRRSTEPFETRTQFQTYIRFDCDSCAAARLVVANAMQLLAPTVLIKWVSRKSLIEAPFLSECEEQYALVPFADGLGVFLCMNESAWLEFGAAVLLETKRTKAVLTGPVVSAQAWLTLCARYLHNGEASHSIERFHDDIIDAFTDEDTLPDNSALMQSQPPLSGSSDKPADRAPLADLGNRTAVGSDPLQHVAAVPKSLVDATLSNVVGKHLSPDAPTQSSGEASQTVDLLLENILSQMPA